MDIIVDFQAYKDNSNNFVIKECAVTTPNYCFIHHWVIAPPHNFYNLSKDRRKEAIWLQLNHHGLKWSDGHIKYRDFLNELRVICSEKSRVLAKGREKCDFLTAVLGVSVIDLEIYGAPSIKTPLQDTYLPVLRCFYHCKHNKHACALTNAFKLKIWVTV